MSFDYIVGLDQVVTGTTGLVVLDCDGQWEHDELLEGSNGDYKAQAKQIVDSIAYWVVKEKNLELDSIRIAIQAEEVYYKLNVHTFRLLVSLLVRLEADLQHFSLYWEQSVKWLKPVRAPDVDREFGIDAAYKNLKGSKKRRAARKEEIQRVVKSIWDKELKDDRADAALHALFALRKSNEVELV